MNRPHVKRVDGTWVVQFTQAGHSQPRVYPRRSWRQALTSANRIARRQVRHAAEAAEQAAALKRLTPPPNPYAIPAGDQAVLDAIGSGLTVLAARTGDPL